MTRIPSLLLSLLLTALPTLAQESAGPGDPSIQGIVVPSSFESELTAVEGDDFASTMTVISVSGLSFFPMDSAIPSSWAATIGGGKFVKGSSDFMQAGVQLPHGALVQAIELEACDESATGYVRLNFFECARPPKGCVLLASLETGTAATPGCGIFFLSLPTPRAVDNVGNSYVFDCLTTSGTAATRIFAARLGYRTPGRMLRSHP